jgi:hypothetical protein
MFEVFDLEGNIYGFVQDNKDIIYNIQCNPLKDHTLSCKTLHKKDLFKGQIIAFSHAAEKD